jgi:S1-C subfamily serine protease
MRPACLAVCLAGWAIAANVIGVARAQDARPNTEELVSAVVRVKTFINPDARTIENLGRAREGSGVVIDQDGLVVTIGYLMVEAHAVELVTNAGRAVPANIVGYDHETGFGLLRAIAPLNVKPMPLGKSDDLKEGGYALIAGAGGVTHAAPARIVSRREFAGSWEYLLDSAIFTMPPYPNWSGAALIGPQGTLVGIGSLIVGDSGGDGSRIPGNMFVPIDLLPPIMGDLLADGRVSTPAKPWLGINAEEQGGRLLVNRVTPKGPAEKAGIARGDVIAKVAGGAPKNLADFYRMVWALGSAGTIVPLEIERNGETRRFDVPSMNRLDHLKLKSTF